MFSNIYNFKENEWVSVKDYIKEQGEFKCLIIYPPGKGKTTALSSLSKIIKESLSPELQKEFLLIDDFLEDSKAIFDKLDKHRYICIAAHGIYLEDINYKNLNSDCRVYIKFYDNEIRQFLATRGRGVVVEKNFYK